MNCVHKNIVAWAWDGDKPVIWRCGDCWHRFVPDSFLFAELKAERDGCAKICDMVANGAYGPDKLIQREVALGLAEAIRERNVVLPLEDSYDEAIDVADRIHHYFAAIRARGEK